MEIRSYNSELAVSQLLFKRVFNNIRIERAEKNGEKRLIPVNCQFGQRSRIFKNWQNAEKRATMKLPMIVINRTGYSRDSQRLNDLHNEVKYEITSKNRIYDYLTPVPVSISYEVAVIAKYPSDIDQIASNFMVFFNSSIFVSCIHPKYDGIKMNNQITMEDSVNEEHPDEIDGSADDFVSTTFNFTFKTFLFGGVKQAKSVPLQVISSFTSSFVSSDVIVLAPNQIDQFQKQHPNAYVSATLTSNVTADLTAYVDSPEISDQVYDEFAPIIKRIEFGIYPTPMLSSFEKYMTKVDSEYEDITYKTQGYISSERYISSYATYEDEEGKTLSVLSALTPEDMKYENVDAYETIAPYKDRLIWKIDGASTREFPDNVTAYRRFQLD